MKRTSLRTTMAIGATAFALLAGNSATLTTYAAEIPANGWYQESGMKYWYENGVRQGTEGRGKEIYDPDSNAWYWLDAVQKGAVAVSKDVYQESFAGEFADREDGTGKWVRYDENGHMIKGWQETENGKYYFDPTTGAMAKGVANIDGVEYAFDQKKGTQVVNGWYRAEFDKFGVSTVEYWYENGVRQGTEGRGKEIYDPKSRGWYWLDAVQGGAMAVNKDVYQESYAGRFGDKEDGTGKWVRYQSSGGMFKGWYVYNYEKGGPYWYFDKETGAMARGTMEINGISYDFDAVTGEVWNVPKGSELEQEIADQIKLDEDNTVDSGNGDIEFDVEYE